MIVILALFIVGCGEEPADELGELSYVWDSNKPIWKIVLDEVESRLEAIESCGISEEARLNRLEERLNRYSKNCFHSNCGCMWKEN